MSNEVATQQPRSIVQDMADQYGMDKRAFEATLKATVIPANVSNEQFAAFLLVAKEYNLNPLTKEIWAFPARNGGISPIVSIDGWANIINSHPAMDGLEYEDIFTDGQLSAIKCVIYRKDRSRPIAITEYMNECKGNTDTWRRWPARMLRHKATIQCARMAFGFSGIYDEDEINRMVDVTPPKSDSLNEKYLGDVTEKTENVTSVEIKVEPSAPEAKQENNDIPAWVVEMPPENSVVGSEAAMVQEGALSRADSAEPPASKKPDMVAVPVVNGLPDWEGWVALLQERELPLLKTKRDAALFRKKYESKIGSLAKADNALYFQLEGKLQGVANA